MSKKSLPEQFRRNTAVSLIICLFVLLWLPTLDLFLHLDHAPIPNENRALAQFPTLTATAAGVHDFPAGLEAYFRDHFGFRNRLIRWERRWKHDLFKDAASPDVITGRDGWLFFSGANMVEYFQGFKRFTPEQLNRWQALLEKRRDWLAQRGIKYLFVIAPDKQSIYPEKLPDWLAHLGTTNRLDQFLEHMRAHSTVPILDLRPVLIAAKKDAVDYLQTDTHWNSYGGFIAYQAMIRALQPQLPALGEPLPLAAFDVKPVPQAGGDLTKLLGQAHPQPEPNGVLFTPRPPLLPLLHTNALERFPKAWAPRTDPTLTLNPAAPGKAILFRDSFAGAWFQFLGHHFHETIYIWQYDWAPDFLEREHPNLVIDEMLERFFNSTDPDKLSTRENLK